MSIPGPNIPVETLSFEDQSSDREPRLNARDASLRSLIVEAALKIVDMEGLTLQPDSITYAAVFRYLKDEHDITITRASVHERIWATTREFRLDVLREIVRMEDFDLGSLYAVAVAVVEDLPTELAASDRTSEAIRLWANEVADARLGTSTKLSSAVLAGLADVADHEISTELFRDYDERTGEAMEVLSPRLEQLLQGLKLVPRTEMAVSSSEAACALAICLTSVVVGFATDRSAGNHLLDSDILLPPSEDGHALRWTSLAVIAKALIDLLFEQAEEAPADSIDLSTPRQPTIDLRDPDSRRNPKGDDGAFDLSRSARRTRSQLRRLVLNAAREVSDRDGFRLRSDSISYKRVFDQIEQDHGFVVNRSSVHKRMWASHEDFRFDVLTTAIARPPIGIGLRADAMKSVEPTMNDDGSMNLRQTIYDCIRMASRPVTVTAGGPPHFFRWHLMKSAIIGERTESKAVKLRQAVDIAHRQFIDECRRRFMEPMRRFGVDVRDEHGMNWDEASMLFVVLVSPASFSCDFSSFSTSNARTLTVPVRRIDGSGNVDHWSLKALMVRALVDFLFKFPD